VTRVSPDIGATGLRANDIILKVNDQSLEHVPHSYAVTVLKNAGDIVTLVGVIFIIYKNTFFQFYNIILITSL